MTIYNVSAWNEYSTDNRQAKLIIKQAIEAESVTEAMDKAQEFAANWNREETRENMKVNLLTCNGFIRAA